VLTFLNEGGMVTPGGTEKQRPRQLLIQYVLYHNSDTSVSHHELDPDHDLEQKEQSGAYTNSPAIWGAYKDLVL
jgi:hypothetical protein